MIIISFIGGFIQIQLDLPENYAMIDVFATDYKLQTINSKRRIRRVILVDRKFKVIESNVIVIGYKVFIKKIFLDDQVKLDIGCDHGCQDCLSMSK